MSERLGMLCDTNIGDPVTLSARKTRLDIFTFKVSGGSTKPRWVDILEHVDVDYCVEVIRDFAGNQRDGAAARTDMKRGSLSCERIL